MTIFDLLFVLLVLASIVVLVAALLRALRGRGAQARRLLGRLAIATAAYFAILILVSLLTPRRLLAPGADHCSDDWCIAVTDATHTPVASGIEWRITFRLSSRMGRGDQRELGVTAYLEDGQGHEYPSIPDAADVPFDIRLAPGQQLSVGRRFIVPVGVPDVGVVVAHHGGPRCCIIAEEGSLLHRRSIVKLE